MPGLSFLSKKSWHTSNVKNVEQVWIAEQQQENEAKKLRELKKQIDEERQILELRQLQAASGQSVKTTDSSLDWMYQGPASQSEQQKASEDYLLGKIFKPQQKEEIADFQKIGNEKQAGALWLHKVNTKNDTFTRLHEDPLLTIKQKEKTTRDNIVNNPVKMARIYHELERQLRDDSAQKESKKDHKTESKKSSKHKKDRTEKHKKKSERRSNNHRDPNRDSHCRRSNSEDSENNGSDVVEHSAILNQSRIIREEDFDCVDRSDYTNSCTKNRVAKFESDQDLRPNTNRDADCYPRKRNNDQQRQNVYDRVRDSDRVRGYQVVADDHSSHREDKVTSLDRKYSSTRSGSTERDTYSRDYDPGHSSTASTSHDNRGVKARYGISIRPDTYKQLDIGRSTNSSSTLNDHIQTACRNNNDRHNDNMSTIAQVKRYGLLEKTSNMASASSINTAEVDKTFLGPDPRLLAERRDKEKQEQDARGKRRKESVKDLDEFEKKRRLESMQADAAVHDLSRIQRHSSISRSSSTSHEGTAGSNLEGRGDAAFLRNMRAEVYNSNDGSVEERLRQQRHYTQRSVDMEGGNGFLKR